ncbi:hypothetical protein ACFL6U_20235 [Planctomycetota bacterium]
MLIFAGILFVSAVLTAGVDSCWSNANIDFSRAVHFLLFGAAMLIGLNTVLNL